MIGKQIRWDKAGSIWGASKTLDPIAFPWLDEGSAGGKGETFAVEARGIFTVCVQGGGRAWARRRRGGGRQRGVVRRRGGGRGGAHEGVGLALEPLAAAAEESGFRLGSGQLFLAHGASVGGDRLGESGENLLVGRRMSGGGGGRVAHGGAA